MSAIGVPSPCTNVCRINEQTGWCEGCARALPEIAEWSRAPDSRRVAILEQLPARRAQLLDLGVLTAADPDDIF